MDKYTDFGKQQQQQTETANNHNSNFGGGGGAGDGHEEEQFLLYLRFENGSYPLRYNVNNIEFLGILNGSLFVKIGDSYYLGEYDMKRNSSSIIFSYEKQTIYETNQCHSEILMKRVLLKPKQDQT